MRCWWLFYNDFSEVFVDLFIDVNDLLCCTDDFLESLIEADIILCCIIFILVSRLLYGQDLEDLIGLVLVLDGNEQLESGKAVMEHLQQSWIVLDGLVVDIVGYSKQVSYECHNWIWLSLLVFPIRKLVEGVFGLTFVERISYIFPITVVVE